jgi:hypothetical protein
MLEEFNSRSHVVLEALVFSATIFDEQGHLHTKCSLCPALRKNPSDAPSQWTDYGLA